MCYVENVPFAVTLHAAEEMEEQAEGVSILCQRCNVQVSLNGEFVLGLLYCIYFIFSSIIYCIIIVLIIIITIIINI